MSQFLSNVGPMLMFLVLAAFVLGFGLAVVMVRNLFKSAIALSFCLLGVAGIFIMLGAEFIAGVQVLIYIGAVTTLIIFAVMLTSGMADPAIRQFNAQRLPGIVVAFITVVVLVLTFVNSTLIAAPLTPDGDSTLGIGKEILNLYILPFDAVTILLLVAMVGAIILARKE